MHGFDEKSHGVVRPEAPLRRTVSQIRLRTKRKVHLVSLVGNRLVGKAFNWPLSAVSSRWQIETAVGLIPISEYFGQKLEEAKEEQRRAAEEQRKAKEEQRRARQRAQAEFRAALDRLPTLLTLPNGEVKWLDGKFYVVAKQSADFAEFKVTTGVRAKLKRACPEFRQQRMAIHAKRKEELAMTRAAQAAALEEVKRLAEERRKNFFTTQDLLAAGWTRHRIKKYLGQPDQVEHFQIYGSHWGVRYWWLKSRIQSLTDVREGVIYARL